MKLSNRKVLIIIVLITVSLGGLILLQTQLMKTALKTEEEAFQNNINAALNNVVRELSSREATHAILNFQIEDSLILNGNGQVKKKMIATKEVDVIHQKADTSSYINKKTTKIFEADKNQIRYEVRAGAGLNHILVFDTINHHYDDSFFDSIPAAWHENNNNRFSYQYMVNDDSITFSGNFPFQDSNRIMMIETILQELNQKEYKPISERIDSSRLFSLLKRSLSESGIDLEFQYAVIDAEKDSVILSNTIDTDTELKKSTYQARLFPFDIFALPNYISLYFPDKQFYIYSKLSRIIIPTVIFLIIITFCFIYSIRTILRQQALSIRLKDFINNMTHEFKTPISTVQLAVEAIEREEILQDKEKIRKFSNMIRSENSRMKNQVDKILQIATLEDKDYELKLEQIDIHKLIREAVELYTVHVQSHQGKIETRFKAEKALILGDKVHITNIIHNLLENAIKYSPSKPTIIINTINQNNTLHLSIHDNGIGIHPDDLPRVFDKYYRVTKGDIHDVKGFGLGLSYVKMMSEAHSGSVHIVSALEKGTEVTVILPVEKI